MQNLYSLPTACQKTEPFPYKLSLKTSKDQVARQDSRHRSPEKGRDAECTYSSWQAMLPECQRKSSMENYKLDKRSHGGQEKRYKAPLKALLKDFNIPTE